MTAAAAAATCRSAKESCHSSMPSMPTVCLFLFLISLFHPPTHPPQGRQTMDKAAWKAVLAGCGAFALFGAGVVVGAKLDRGRGPRTTGGPGGPGTAGHDTLIGSAFWTSSKAKEERVVEKTTQQRWGLTATAGVVCIASLLLVGAGGWWRRRSIGPARRASGGAEEEKKTWREEKEEEEGEEKEEEAKREMPVCGVAVQGGQGRRTIHTEATVYMHSVAWLAHMR